MRNGELLTARQAAGVLGYTVQHVRLLVRAGQLVAQKAGRDWIIDRESVMDLKARRSTAPLISISGRGRKPSTARVSASPPVCSPARLVSVVKDSPLTNPAQPSPSERDDRQPLADIAVERLEPADIGDMPSLHTSRGGRTGQVDPRNKLNELTATEWLPETVSVWTQKGLGASHPDAQIERQHPAPFSFTDVARLILFFTKRDAVVLDPFVGVGSTLKACALHARNGVGIELSQRYVQLTHERLSRELPASVCSNHNQKVLQGDAREVLPELQENSVDFVVTSPPYGSILHKKDHKARQERIANGLDTRYSDDPRDLGNIQDYTRFVAEVTKILGACGRLLKPRKYMAVVVSDYRHGSKYVMFHADLAHSLEDFDLRLRGITVLYQRHKRVFPYGYPSSYVPNIHHQFILVLQNDKET